MPLCNRTVSAVSSSLITIITTEMLKLRISSELPSRDYPSSTTYYVVPGVPHFWAFCRRMKKGGN